MHCCGSHFLRTTFNYFHTFHIGWIFEHCYFVPWHSVKYEGMKIHLKMIGCLKVRPQKSLVQAHILACCQKFKFHPVQNRAYNLNRFEFMPMPSSWKTIFINSCIARTAKKMWMIHISLVLPSDFYLVADDVVKHAIFHLASADLRL